MYSKDVKEKAFAMFNQGVSVDKICELLGPCRSTLFLWIQQSKPDHRGRIPRKEYEEKLELKRLRVENQIFRLTDCTPSSPISDKLRAVDQYKNQFNIHRLCKTLELRKSTYYHHLLRSPEKTQIEILDEKLRPLVLEIFIQSRRTFGTRRIKAKLQEQGFNVSERRISRLMKELEISAKGPKPMKNSANDRQYKYYPNKLKGNFLTEAPNRVWVSDIT